LNEKMGIPLMQRYSGLRAPRGDYATVTIDIPAAELGQQFVSKDGGILAVPDTAVIFTGAQKIVFRQGDSPSVFDAVQVELGPLITGPNDIAFYPVLKGLQPGDRVVTVGSYLLDAENKVSGAAGSIYYGGTGAGSQSGPSTGASVRPSTPEDEDLKVSAGLAKLSTPDRKQAEAQKICPIQGTRLGSMGTPVKLLLNGEPVFLCCKSRPLHDLLGTGRHRPTHTAGEIPPPKQAHHRPGLSPARARRPLKSTEDRCQAFG
jgi:hypothetical protein